MPALNAPHAPHAPCSKSEDVPSSGSWNTLVVVASKTLGTPAQHLPTLSLTHPAHIPHSRNRLYAQSICLLVPVLVQTSAHMPALTPFHVSALKPFPPFPFPVPSPTHSPVVARRPLQPVAGHRPWRHRGHAVPVWRGAPRSLQGERGQRGGAGLAQGGCVRVLWVF